MGASNSRYVSRPSRRRVNHTNRFTLSSLLPCGASTSRATYEIEDHPTELLVDSATDFNGQVQKVTEEPSLSHSTEARISSSCAETGTSFGSSIQSFENANLQDSSRSVVTRNQRECLFKRKELVPPHEVSTDHSHNDTYTDSSNTASASLVEEQSSDPVSVNSSANKDAVNNIDNSVDSSIPPISLETLHQRSSSPQVYEDFSSRDVESHSSGATTFQNSDSNPGSSVSDLPATSMLQENEPHEETIPPSLGFLVPNRERGHVNESVLHIDVVTISSNTLSRGNTDAIDHGTQSYGRRPFWDAFSHRGSRRFRISPTIVFSAGDPDDLASQDRWLLDLSSGFSNDEVGEDFEYLGSRFHRSNARMLHSRSQIWERLRDGLNETDQWTNSCPLGLHPDGRCFCEPFSMTDESNTGASMSRVVMLAEALFEVFLDEIHHQPTPFSLSVASLPAPESVVDSFPLKCHKTVNTIDGGSNTEQCHICLVEYEEADKIRVLPCSHEFHMACVDKWLKEIHGICPLCRGNVCGRGFTESSASNTSTTSMI